MKKKVKRRLAAGGVFLAAALLLTAAAWASPSAAELYSQYIYKGITETIGRISGLFPFSAAVLCLYILTAAFLITLIKEAVKGIRNKRVKEEGIGWLSLWFFAGALLFFLYVINCGINYCRVSFSEKEGFLVEGYSDEELADVCLWLTDEINERSALVLRDEEGQMKTKGNVGEEAVKAMNRLGEIYPSLKGYYPRPKELVFSQFLSWQNLTGIYSPFTIEANYNGDMTDYNIPFTICHELSHLRGFMQEEEANFIAFLGCTCSGQTQFQYSGYLSAWIYAMNELNDRDVEQWSKIRPLLSEEADRDVKPNSAFWQQYEGQAAKWSGKINDAYLKANGQTDGVESYNRMVELVVSCYRMQNGSE